MALPVWLRPLARKVRPTRLTKLPSGKKARRLEVEFLEGRVVPTVFTWDGTSSSFWSDGGNWGGTAPTGIASDVLVFPNAPAGTTSTVDDIGGGTFGNISFADSYTVNLTGNLIMAGDMNQIGGGLFTTTLFGVGNLNLGGATRNLNAVASDTLQFNVVITGTGAVNVNNGTTGTVELDQTDSYSGTTSALGGFLDLGATLNSIPGNLVITGATVTNQASEQIADSADVTVNGGGLWDLNGFTETVDPLTLNGGTTDLNGGTLVLAGNVVAGGATTSFIQDTATGGNMDLGGATRTFSVGAGSTLDVSVPITGTGGLTKEVATTLGSGDLYLHASVANTYSGTTTVNDGTLELNSTSTAVPHDLVIGDNTGASNTAIVSTDAANQTASSTVVTVNSDGEFLLNDTNQAIAGLIGTGNVSGGAGALTNTLTISVPALTTYTFDGVISGGINTNGLNLIKGGLGVQVLTGINTYTGATTINNGELQVDGQIGAGAVQVNLGGILGGDGTVTGAVTVAAGGEIDPGAAGDNVGTLNVPAGVTFQAGSTYKVDTAFDPCDGSFSNDFLNGGSITISGVGVQLDLNIDWCAYNGTAFDIIHSTTAYGGVFYAGIFPMTEGSTQQLAGSYWQITYLAPPGHNVVITENRPTATWTGLGATNLWSDPDNWLSLVVPSAAQALVFPAAALQKFNVNDLAPGFQVGEIDFTGVGGGYGISGNAIVLDAGYQDYATGQNVVHLDATLDCISFWLNTGGNRLINTGAIDLAGFDFYVGDSLTSSTKLSGAITDSSLFDTGSLNKIGAGLLTLAGASSNTFTGSTEVHQGTLNLAKTNPAQAVSGPLIIGDCGLAAAVNILYDAQISDSSPVDLGSSGALNFGTSEDTIGDLTLDGGTINVDLVLGHIGLSGNVIVNADTVMGQKIDLGSTTHTFTVAAGKSLTLSGQIIGTTGGLVFDGPGTVNIEGIENYYTGTTWLKNGTLNLNKTNDGINENNAAVLSYGPLIVGDGVHAAVVNYLNTDQLKDNQPVTVNAGSTVNMNGFGDAIGSLALNGGAWNIGALGTLTINGNISTTGTSSLTGGTLYIKEVTRNINVTSGTFTLAATVTSIFNAHLTKTGPGTLTLGAGHSYPEIAISAGTLNVPVGAIVYCLDVSGTGVANLAGTVTLDASVEDSGILNLLGGTILGPLVVTSGTVTGNGTIAGATFTGGTFAPGTPSAVGTVTTTQAVSFAPGVIFDATLNKIAGPTLVSDLLTGAAPINLGGSTLQLSAVGGYVPTLGDQFTIVHSSVGISGVFANAPTNGSIVTLGIYNFAITYQLDFTNTFVENIVLTCVP